MSLLNSFISSQINLDFHTGSDHRPVQTILSLETPKKARTHQRNWRTLDLDQVKKEAKNLPPIPPLLNREEVDNYLENLDKALQELADKTTRPLRDSKYTVPWWNQEIKEKIKEERKLRRKVFQNQEPVYKLEKVIKEKKHLIKNTKRKILREQLQNLAETQKHWKIAKWGKEKAGKPPELPIVPELTKQDGETARTFTEKVEVFKTQFFPLPLQPVPESQDQPANHQQHQLSQEISKEDIHNILKKKKPFTAPGKDTLPNGFLKVLEDSFNEKIAKVLEACWKLEYFPDRYKAARTIYLRKPSKGSYCYAKAWRPIALLNTIGKLMEALAATKLSELAEKENLLPEIQMGFRKERSTESALFLLTSQVEKVWKEGMVASLLSLDISGAYDRVLPEILKKILERKGIPSWFVNWIFSFTTQRKTSLVFDDSESSLFPVHCGVSQGSPLSPILFLFYISDLHNIVHTPEKGVSALGFADDTNLLAFSPSLKSNLLKLKSTHSKCLDWARKHGMKFAPEKYELLYFSRRRTDNLQLSLRLGEVVLQSKKEVRILGLHYDSKLLWKKHQKIMLQKASKFFSALSRTTFSTWGLPVLSARLVYTAILRSLLSYAVGVWFNPHKKPSNISSLNLFQTKCLKTIGGVFKATPTFLIEGELFLPPLDLYFKFRTATFLQSFYFSNTSSNPLSSLLYKLFSQITVFVSTLRTPPKSVYCHT